MTTWRSRWRWDRRKQEGQLLPLWSPLPRRAVRAAPSPRSMQETTGKDAAAHMERDGEQEEVQMRCVDGRRASLCHWAWRSLPFQCRQRSSSTEIEWRPIGWSSTVAPQIPSLVQRPPSPPPQPTACATQQRLQSQLANHTDLRTLSALSSLTEAQRLLHLVVHFFTHWRLQPRPLALSFPSSGGIHQLCCPHWRLLVAPRTSHRRYRHPVRSFSVIPSLNIPSSPSTDVSG